MANTVLIVSEEFLNRIKVGLQEIPAKFANPVLIDIENQVKAAETGAKEWIQVIETHLSGIKTKAETVLGKVEQKVESAVSSVKAEVAAVEHAFEAVKAL